MQDIDHHMDDLLRKAAENYPLKAGDGDWDAVAGQLTAVTPSVSNSNYRKYGVTSLLLLLCLVVVDNFITRDATTVRTPAYNIQQHVVKDEPVEQKNNLPIFQKNIQYSAASSSPIKEQISNAASISEPNLNEPVLLDKSGTNLFNREASGIKTVGTVNTHRSIYVNFPMKTTINANNLVQSGTDHKVVKRTPRLYVGLASGPEFNEVKGQGLEKTGFDIGLIAGYRLNRKLSFESGLFFSKKYYYTDGKYFKMEMPGMKLLSLEGSCSLLELPLKLKYDVIERGKNKVFTTTGISSYMLIQEKNNYVTEVNGTQQRMVAAYKEKCRYFAATVDVSLGYQHTIGTSTNLRIEPYLQLPLQGIGVGTIPVKSAGLHIGLIRSIH